jgi:hypothetical protein
MSNEWDRTAVGLFGREEPTVIVRHDSVGAQVQKGLDQTTRHTRLGVEARHGFILLVGQVDTPGITSDLRFGIGNAVAIEQDLGQLGRVVGN